MYLHSCRLKLSHRAEDRRAQTGETNMRDAHKKVGFPLKFVPSSHYCHPVLTSKNKTHRFFLTYKEKAKLVCVCVWSWHICANGIGWGEGFLVMLLSALNISITSSAQHSQSSLSFTSFTHRVFPPPVKCLQAQVAERCLQGKYRSSLFVSYGVKWTFILEMSYICWKLHQNTHAHTPGSAQTSGPEVTDDQRFSGFDLWVLAFIAYIVFY